MRTIVLFRYIITAFIKLHLPIGQKILISLSSTTVPPEPLDYPTYEVDCARNASHYSFAVCHEELEHGNYSLNECQFMVNAPFNSNAAVNFTGLLIMNYIEILKMGFILNWTAPDCQYCEKSGGRCGFDGNEFLCFCKDKSYLKSCGSGNNTF